MGELNDLKVGSYSTGLKYIMDPELQLEGVTRCYVYSPSKKNVYSFELDLSTLAPHGENDRDLIAEYLDWKKRTVILSFPN